VNLNVIIPEPNVHLGEIFGIMKAGDQGEGKGKQIRILYRPVINVLVILTQVKFSALLSNEEEPTSLRGL